jgi:glycosyltransferase involved in cell wall biosynthesis
MKSINLIIIDMKSLKINKYFRRIQIKRKVNFRNTAFSVSKDYFRMAVVIPVYGEYEYIDKTLSSLSANSSNYLKKTLILLVINNPAEGANSCYIKENQHLLRELNDGSFIIGEVWDNPPLNPLPGGEQKGWVNEHLDSRERQSSSLNLAWIDASSKGQELPGKGGVGMARKLGMDSALEYIDWNDDPIIISLDADTIVEKNYLEAIERFFDEHKNISAASVNFKHLPGKTFEEDKAIRKYEYLIRCYVENLRKAGSPYAYHAIGSAIACRTVAYVRAGGMKLHRGGEDFYFMQGLRKLGPIMEITDTIVYQSARPSDRVPFGTGPKVQESLNGKELKLYNSKIFVMLKETLLKVEKWIDAGNVVESKQLIDSLAEEAKSYFVSLNFNMIWPNILDNNVKDKKKITETDKEKLLWAFHVWFDAFKTLKFVHYLERRYPEIYPKTDIVLL